MAAITEEAKVYIITALACFDEQKQVIKDVKEKFGFTVSHQQVGAYDPATVSGKRLSKQFKELFKTTREKFLADTSSIPIANAAVRLRILQRHVNLADQRNNTAMVASLLEQAAKETGGAFTNKQKVENAGVVGTMNVPAPVAGTVPADEAYKRMMGGGR
jgi:hypothetical protein